MPLPIKQCFLSLLYVELHLPYCFYTKIQKKNHVWRNKKIGGNNNSQAKIVTTLFVGIVLIIFVTGIILKQLSPTTTLLLLILILSFKIIWMQQQTQKSMHFQFWILNSIEIRINELDKKQKKLEKMIEGLEKKKE